MILKRELNVIYVTTGTTTHAKISQTNYTQYYAMRNIQLVGTAKYVKKEQRK